MTNPAGGETPLTDAIIADNDSVARMFVRMVFLARTLERRCAELEADAKLLRAILLDNGFTVTKTAHGMKYEFDSALQAETREGK